ncbi:MAG: hypothetical protein BYD32DRAFT_146167 [Podila humilis]|nr:MAG: hypothetical protein BYD32DRAFT_146167 [Podila humilis]
MSGRIIPTFTTLFLWPLLASVGHWPLAICRVRRNSLIAPISSIRGDGPYVESRYLSPFTLAHEPSPLLPRRNTRPTYSTHPFIHPSILTQTNVQECANSLHALHLCPRRLARLNGKRLRGTDIDLFSCFATVASWNHGLKTALSLCEQATVLSALT